MKMDYQEMGIGGGVMDWMDLSSGRDRWQAIVNEVMDLHFS